MRSICLSGLAALAVGSGCGGLAASSAGDSGNDRSTPDAPRSPMDSGASDGSSVEAREGSDGTAFESCSGEAAPGLVTLALPPGQFIGQIVVTATGVYTTGAGTVMSLPLGGGTSTTLVAEAGSPGALAVDATHAAWVAGVTYFGGTAIMSVPLVGGTPTTIASGQFGVSYIAVDSESVYWTSSYFCCPYTYPCCPYGNGSVMKVALGGGTPTTLASGPYTFGYRFDGLALDDSSVYWINLNVVMRVPLHGGSPETFAHEFSRITGIAVDATNLYWTTTGGRGFGGSFAAPAVVKKPLAGGAPTTIGGGVGTDPSKVVTDGTNVYWSISLGSNSDVMRVPVSGGTPATLASYNGAYVQLAGVDCTSLYWTVGSEMIVRLTPK